MSKSTFALSAAALLITLSVCSSPGSEFSESARLATAVAGTLDVVSKGISTSNPLQTPEKLGTEQPDPTALQPLAPSTENLRLAYSSAGDIWLIAGAKPPLQLSHTGHADQVLLSSDGALVAYVHNGFAGDDLELRVVNVDGSGDRVLLDQAAFDSLYPLEETRHFQPNQMAFLSGTQRLLLNTQATFEGPGLLKTDDLLAFDVDAESPETLLAPGTGGDFYPSPDGTKLAIIQTTSIGFSDSDGSNLHPGLLTFPSVMTYSDYSYYPEPVWAPDSSHFAVVIPSEDPLAPDPTSTVWIISVDGSPPTQTAFVVGQTFFSQAFGSPVIAPDLSKVVFMRPGSEQNEEHLILTDIDNGSEIVYTTGNLRWVGWAPDSSAFVYSVDPMDLYLGVIGELPQPLGYGVQFRWINDHDYLFLTGTRGAWTLMMGGAGAAVEEIVRPIGDFIAFDFVPWHRNPR